MPLPRLRAVMLVLAGILSGPVPAIAQEPSDAAEDLRRIEGEIEDVRDRQAVLDARAAEIEAELAELRRRSIEAAADALARQQELQDLEAELAALEAEETEREAALAHGRERLAGLLAGLVRLARLPPEALIARPGAPVDTVRSALLLDAAIPAIDAETAKLRSELVALSEIRADLLRHRDEAETARRRLADEIAGLDRLAAERAALLAGTEAERREEEERLASLAGQAEDVRDLIERLEADRRAREEAAREAERRRAAAIAEAERRRAAAAEEARRQAAALPLVDGALLPAAGKLVLRYGQEDRFGQPSRGVTIEGIPGAPVVAPLPGVVRFAGEFRGYGRILILEHPGGYHSMIAGLGRIDALVDQQVVAGEPVASVPQNRQDQPSLVYFEFRREGQPINPIEGLAQARE